ncbi:MAG: PQQ-binding-like beta-propeller repeat protein [Planctomycetota bacterium]
MNRDTVDRTSLGLALVALLFVAADWTRFRGPDAGGTSDDTGVPTTWSAEENVVWKTALPGFGASSPITLGDRVFLTCYSGYGFDADDPGDQEKLQLNVLAINRADGKILWAKGCEARLPDTEYGGFIRLHGYASSTPATDGEAVYAFFGRSGVLAYSTDGEPLWRAYVGDGSHGWGSASSPVLYKNLVIVGASVESQSIVALDKSSGEEVWRVEGIEKSWSTPLVVETADGSQELVVSMLGKVLGLDPATGKELWQCAGVKDYVCAGVIAHEGIVYITGGRKPQSFAIRAGGRGDVTETHLVWEINKASKVATPVYHDGHLYWIDNKAAAVCVDAKTGEVVYEERLEISGKGDKVYASLVLVDGKLYGVSREDGAVVLAAKPEFEQIARNDLGDPSIFNATPVPSNGQLLLRSDRFLYCIGE